MQIVIIEDERLAAEKLKSQLLQIIPGAKILCTIESVEDAVNWFSANSAPDLVFMDIQLDDGVSFEIFNEVNVESPVIFTTAYDKYAIQAFKVNSVDYLLKPIEKEALQSAINKFRKIYADKQSFEEKVKLVIEQVSKQYKSRFFIKIGAKFHSIPVNEICCFFVEERSTFLRTQNGKTFDLDDSLDRLQQKVDPEQFFRVNRNFLLNINCISDIISYSSNRLKINLCSNFESDIIVSRDKVSEFKDWMDR